MSDHLKSTKLCFKIATDGCALEEWEGVLGFVLVFFLRKEEPSKLGNGISEETVEMKEGMYCGIMVQRNFLFFASKKDLLIVVYPLLS